MSFPKKGKFFPKQTGYDGEASDSFAQVIAATLRRELGESRAGVKTVEGWTGANEKTIKNWFAGKYGPSGEHLVALVRHSDEVLIAFLAMAGRENLKLASSIFAAERAVVEALEVLRELSERLPGGTSDD
ncbi:hypothetical protein [Roseinatronobacter sp.]|uniref:hypothetical protein n=1 Tax=Roseinatronobacter sp. TaxID=1945755 RepID=UPI003F6ED360